MRTLAMLVGILIMLTAVALALLPVFVSAQDLARVAADRIEDKTGRRVSFSNAQLALWPNISIQLTDVALSNPSWAKEKNLFSAKKIVAVVALQPLFSKRVEIKKFILEAPVVRLETAPDGRRGWDFSSPAAAESAPSSAASVGDFSNRSSSAAVPDRDRSSSRNLVVLNGIRAEGTMADVSGPAQAVISLTYDDRPYKVDIDLARIGDVTDAGSLGKVRLESGDMSAVLTGRFSTQKTLFDGDVDFRSGFLAAPATGKARLALRDRPFLFARLDTPRIEIKETLPSAEARAGSSEAGQNAAPLPLDVFKIFDADLVFNVGGFRRGSLETGSFTLAAKIEDGRLRAALPGVALFGGRAEASLDVQAGAATPIHSFLLKASGVDVRAINLTLFDFDRLDGRADLSAALTAVGGSKKDIISTLAGNGSFRIVDGSVRGLDLAGIAALLQKRLNNVSIGSGETKFTTLSGTFTVASGMVRNTDLVVQGPLVSATGFGTVDLPGRQMDYRLVPALAGEKGLVVPVDIRGTFGDLQINPDFSQTIDSVLQNKDAAARAIREQGRELRQDLKDLKQKLREDPAGALKNLLGGAP